MIDFGHYLASLAGSWRALAAPHPDALVVADDGFVGTRHPRPVLNNAVVLDPGRVGEVERFYGNATAYAVWSRDDDHATAGALDTLGYRRDITTRPMVCRLTDLADARGRPAGRAHEVDPVLVAELNGVPPDLLAGVPGIRAYATEHGESGLVLIPVGTDVNVSFVATRPDARRRGLAAVVILTALVAARDGGFATASLQATTMAEGLYTRIGFRPVGRWQEWLPAHDAAP